MVLRAATSEPASEIYNGCSCQPLFLLSLEGSHLFSRLDLPTDGVCVRCALKESGQSATRAYSASCVLTLDAEMLSYDLLPLYEMRLLPIMH